MMQDADPTLSPITNKIFLSGHVILTHIEWTITMGPASTSELCFQCSRVQDFKRPFLVEETSLTERRDTVTGFRLKPNKHTLTNFSANCHIYVHKPQERKHSGWSGSLPLLLFKDKKMLLTTD